MEAILLALLTAYGLPALVAGAFALGVWTIHIKYLLPERTKRREQAELREERHLQVVEKNTAAFNELQHAVTTNTLAFSDLKGAVSELGKQLHNLDGAVVELRDGIADLRGDIGGTRKEAERLAQDVDAVKGDIKELKGYISGRSR